MNGYVDFHSELLPNVNKKSIAKSNEDSIRILNVLHKAKIKTVVATPYFLPLEENVASFIKRRDTSAALLDEALKDLSLPRVILGAEVLYTPSLLELPDIEKLFEVTRLNRFIEIYGTESEALSKVVPQPN